MFVAAPKVYAFDTGFVCYYRGWNNLRQDDMGTLWEHYVLNEILAATQRRQVFYWRDKQKHEIDFILLKKQEEPTTVECKWKASDFDPANLKIFRKIYQQGLNYVVAHDVTTAFTRHYGDISVRFTGLEGLIEEL